MGVVQACGHADLTLKATHGLLAAQTLLAYDLEGDDVSEHLHGLVPVAVQWMLNHGARPDPEDPPRMDTTTARPSDRRIVCVGVMASMVPCRPSSSTSVIPSPRSISRDWP